MFLSRQLIQFFAIAENSSLAEAAEKLSLTPSALSHGIHDLECKTGISLIKRSGQKSSLTIAGKDLYQQLLPYCMRIKNISDNLSGKNKKSFNIKTDSLFYSPLKDRIMSFCKENPDLNLSVASAESIDIKNEILKNNTDIVILSNYSTNIDEINHLDLTPEKIGIIAHNSLLEKYDSPSDLITNERLIKINTKNQKYILNKFLSKFKTETTLCPSIDITAEYDICKLISDSAGYSLIPENNAIIENMKNKNCSFISLPREYNISIKRCIYFKEIHNQTVSDFISKVVS